MTESFGTHPAAAAGGAEDGAWHQGAFMASPCRWRSKAPVALRELTYSVFFFGGGPGLPNLRCEV